MAIAARPQYQGPPGIGVPLVTPNLAVTVPWYRFLTDVHNVCFSQTDQVNPNSGLFPSADMRNSIYSLGQAQQGTAGDVATLTGEVATLTGQVAALATQVTSQQGQISTLQSQVASLTAQVTNLQVQLDSATIGPTGPTALAGGGGALPATVATYLDLTIGATHFRIPLYQP